MANYTIGFVAQDHIDVYCENKCTGKCYNAITNNKDSSGIKVMQEGPCYKVFSVNHNFSSDWRQIKMINRGQCRIADLVEYRDVQRIAMLALDNTRSVAQLCEILQQKYIGDLKSADISLSGLKE